MKIADKFTLSRILLSPIFFVLYFIPVWTGNGNFASISVYILIPLLGFMEFTDYLDGYFARKNNEVSDFGKLFDPFGDVLVHLTVFFCFVLSNYMPSIIFMLILYREFGMLFIRLMATREGIVIGARKGGKAKTVLYVIAGLYSLFLESVQRLGMSLPVNLELLKNIGFFLYILGLIMAYVSFMDYLIYLRKKIKKR